MDDIEEAVKKVLDEEEKEKAAKEAERAAIRAEEILKLESDPKYKGMFNVKKETADEPKGDAAKQETYEFIWHLRHGINPGLSEAKTKEAFRTLDSLTAAEGLPLIPQDMLNEIVLQRRRTSIPRRSNMPIYQTGVRIFNIPAEVTPLTAPAVIVEENAYVENEIVYANVPVTLVKRGSLVSCTEELLEDQNLFQSYITAAFGKAFGLAENVDLYALLSAKAGSHAVTADAVILQDDPFALYFSLGQLYRDGAAWIMNDASMGQLRQMLLAATYRRAFGEFPDFGGGDIENFMGKPVYCDDNWLADPAAGLPLITLANLSAGTAMVESNRGMQIMVDPYTAKGTGWVLYYAWHRYSMAVTQTNCYQNLDNV